MANSWKKRFTYSSNTGVEHEVNGNKMMFYPNRVGLLTELADISKPVAHALSTLFGEGPSDQTSVSETYKDKVKKDMKSGQETYDSSVDKITVEAVSPEVAEHRRKQKNAAIDELIDGLTNERNKLLFGRLIMDSLREEFPYKKERSVSEVEEFLFGDEKEGEYHGLDGPMIAQLIGGWLKANSKVFGATGEKIAGLVRGKLAALQGLSQSTETTTNTDDGSSSRKLSLVGSDSDSASTSSND